MNPPFSWLASPEWGLVVKTLLHSLWQGALLALILFVLFRSQTNPIWRHRLALGALGMLLLSSVVMWSVLSQLARIDPMKPVPAPSAAIQISAEVPGGPVDPGRGPIEQTRSVQHSDGAGNGAVAGVPWNACLAFAWLAGMALMLTRVGVQVGRAGRLCRSGRPLTDERVLAVLAEAQRALGVARRVRAIVTDALSSPAVIGVIVPILILPGTLLTTLTTEQLRCVLLHELAHIRRGDYWANLFQLLVEAVFFFNPAAWWISHHARREREACCDALATRSGGAPADYARALVHVAEAALNRPKHAALAALAFAGDREPSSLIDRVQRLLVPGHRPTLRFTWSGMLMALVVGGGLLMLSAVGTRLTVAAILSPQERMDRIAEKLKEYGEPRDTAEADSDGPSAPTARVTGRVIREDGLPLSGIKWVNFYHVRHNSSGVASGRIEKDGTFSTDARFGRFCAGLNVPGFAPVTTTWVDIKGTNPIENLELVLTLGFEGRVELTDQATSRPITNAVVKSQFWIREMGTSLGMGQTQTADAAGTVQLAHCSDSVAIQLTVNAPGFEITDQRFDRPTPGEPLRMRLRPGRELSGLVLSRLDEAPVAGATVRVIHESGREQRHYQWNDEARVLAVTDEAGRFSSSQLRSETRYWLGVSAPGHESIIMAPSTTAMNALKISLGPELIVRGQVHGALQQLQKIDNDWCLSRSISEKIESTSYAAQEWVRLRVVDGIGYFQFTNRVAGPVTLSGSGYSGKREISAPVDDWVVNLRPLLPDATNSPPQREVVFRFKHPSGISPRGTVAVLVPDNLDPMERTAHWAVMGITNGEVRTMLAIGGHTQLEPRQTLGFWFRGPGYFNVTNGPGPIEVDVPCLPAGAIFAKAWNADGSPAARLSFGVREVSRAPGRKSSESFNGASDNFHGDDPRKWASGPLPLGGAYILYGWRGNTFAVSRPIRLTDEAPTAEVELKLPAGRTVTGVIFDADGHLVTDTRLDVSFTPSGKHGEWGLSPAFTDERGQFRLEGMTPESGDYVVQVNVPEMMAERLTLSSRANSPQTIRLRRGRTLAGRIVEAGTGQPIPGVELRTGSPGSRELPMLTTTTDAEGQFAFKSMGNARYQFYPRDGQLVGEHEFMADGRTNLVVAIKLYEWSKVKAKAAK